jgi:hypothetical protein
MVQCSTKNINYILYLQLRPNLAAGRKLISWAIKLSNVVAVFQVVFRVITVFIIWLVIMYLLIMASGVNRRVQSVLAHGPPSPGGPQRKRPNRLAGCGLSRIGNFCVFVDFCVISLANMPRDWERLYKVIFCKSIS